MRLKLTVLCLAAQCLSAQTPPALDGILARLDRLESENQRLLEEVRALRKELTATAAAPAAERLEVVERRTEDQDQSKVEASQRFPLAVTGMALFNAWSNGRNNGGLQDPLFASLTPTPSNTGASFRQTIVGLRFNGPRTFLGGRVTGAADFDLWAGDATSLNHLLRLRTATLRIDWANTSFSVAQDKPLISTRDPDSLAQVSYSPLTGAGNPWLWQPQVRLERRFSLNENSGIRAQAALYQTRESLPNLPAYYDSATTPPPPSPRPGWQGRAEYWRKWGASGRLEIASGFHASTSHILGASLPSRAFSLDWLFTPLSHWEITGAYYHGQNLGTIGGGPAVSLLRSALYTPLGSAYFLTPVHQNSGWAQSAWQIAPKLKLNLFAGDQSNRASDLPAAAVRNNLAWGGNFMYRLAPNVIASFEALQLRTEYLNSGTRLHNHYDLALAYLF